MTEAGSVLALQDFIRDFTLDETQRKAFILGLGRIATLIVMFGEFHPAPQ